MTLQRCVAVQFTTLLRVAPLLVLLAWGAADAAGGASCSVMNLPDPDPANPQPLLSLTTFVPDAGCWYKSTIQLLADAGAFEMTASFAKYLVAILFGIYGVSAMLDVKARAQAVKMVLATVVVGSLLATPADRNSTTNYIRVFMLDSWPATYQKAADWSDSLLGSNSNEQGSLGNYVRTLMEQMATLEYNATVFDRVRGKINTALESNQLGQNADEIKTNVNRIIEEDRAANQPVFSNMRLWTTIGSLMVMGLFTVFAAIIYFTAINLIMSALLLPVQLAFVGVLQWGYFTKSLIGYVSSLLTTVLVSVFAVAVMKIAIGAPTQAMAGYLGDANNLMTTKIQEYATLWEKCGFDLGYATCQITNLALDINVQANSVRSMVVTLGLTLLMAMVASGIAMNQLRRIPAMISGAIGISGGGESSGTGKNPMSTLAQASGLAMLGQHVQRSMMTSAVSSSKSNSGAQGGKPAPSGDSKSGSAKEGAAPSSAVSAQGGTGSAEGAGTAPGIPPEAQGASEGKTSLGERAGARIAAVPNARGLAMNAARRAATGAKSAAMRHPGDRAIFQAIGRNGGNAAVDQAVAGAQILREEGVLQGARTMAGNARDNVTALSLGAEARAQRLGADRRDAEARQEQARRDHWTGQAAEQGFDVPPPASEAPQAQPPAAADSAALTGTPTAPAAGTAGPGPVTSGAPATAGRTVQGTPGQPARPTRTPPVSPTAAARQGTPGAPVTPPGPAASGPAATGATPPATGTPAGATGRAVPLSPVVNAPAPQGAAANTPQGSAGSPSSPGAPAVQGTSGGFGSGSANHAAAPAAPPNATPASGAASTPSEPPKGRPLHRARAASTTPSAAGNATGSAGTPAGAPTAPLSPPPPAPAAGMNEQGRTEFSGDSRKQAAPAATPAATPPPAISDRQPTTKTAPVGGEYAPGTPAPAPDPTPPRSPNTVLPTAFETPQAARLSAPAGVRPAPKAITVRPDQTGPQPDARDLGAFKADTPAMYRGAAASAATGTGAGSAKANLSVEEARHLAPVTSPDATLPTSDTIGEPPRS